MSRSDLLDQCSLNTFIAIDLETTGLVAEEEYIIEVSAVKYIAGKEDSHFSHLVSPGKQISPFIEDLTGITNSMVKDKPPFSDILDGLVDFIADYPIVGHNVKFDIDFIEFHSKGRLKLSKTNQVCDTYLLSKFVLFSNEQHSLEAISEFYNLSIEGSHRAINDARNSAEVLIKLIEELSSFDKNILLRIKNLFHGREIPNSMIIKNIECSSDFDARKHRNFKPRGSTYRYKSNGATNYELLDDIISDGGTLYRETKFQYRQSQHEMAKLIETNIESNSISLIEAGTGLGKTYAYLIPLILTSKEKDLPLIISTYTKSLQDQLFYKDLKNVLSLLNIDINALLLKGRDNYICLNRLDQIELNSSDLIRNFESHDFAAIIAWSFYTKSGDIDECYSFSLSRSARIWNLLKSDVRFCQKQCGHSDSCFYSKNLDCVNHSNVIVVNHALLMSDALDSRNLLPKEHLFAIDEAHELFKATKHILTYTYDKSFFNNFLNDINTIINKKINDDAPEEIDDIKDAINLLIDDIDSFFKSYLESKEMSDNAATVYPATSLYNDMQAEFHDCSPTLEELISNLKNLQNMILLIEEKYSEDKNLKGTGLIDLMNQFSDQIDILMESSESNDYLSWMKYFHKNGSSSINYLYKNIGKILFEKYFSYHNPGLLCSATLTVNNSFDYFISSIGLDDFRCEQEIKKIILSSPFYLEEQLDFYSFKSDLDINSSEYIDNISEQIFEISSHYNKRMLVLCTSYKQASQIKNKLKPQFSKINKKLLVHEKGRSKNSLIRAYKSSNASVLIGTMAFWEGIDLPGDELSILMIIRIPFSNPNDPYVRYASERLTSKGENSFNQLQVPEACLKMKQGFGRLIRTEFDSGIFIITDPRIYKSSYGDRILNSFPVETKPYQHFSTILNNQKIL